MRTPFVATPAVPVAVKVTGEPLRPVFVAVRVFEPAVLPSVHVPAKVAMPSDPVVAVIVPLTEPPVPFAKVTLTPLTGLLFASLIITLGAIATAEPATADCASPAFTAICDAAPAVNENRFEVAAKRLVGVKVRTKLPAVPDMLKLLKVATPLVFVFTVVVPPSVPVPLVIVATTSTFEALTLLPFAS